VDNGGVEHGIVGDKFVEQRNVAADHISVPGCKAEFHVLLPLFCFWLGQGR
jgi:hypothetical protein